MAKEACRGIGTQPLHDGSLRRLRQEALGTVYAAGGFGAAPAQSDLSQNGTEGVPEADTDLRDRASDAPESR
jgi:hypothetical protein